MHFQSFRTKLGTPRIILELMVYFTLVKLCVKMMDGELGETWCIIVFKSFVFFQFMGSSNVSYYYIVCQWS